MELFMICTISILGTVLALHLKTQRPEYSAYIAIITALIILVAVISRLSEVYKSFSAFQLKILNRSTISILIKIISLTYLADFASNVCKDAGYSGISGQIDVFGKLTVLVLSLPILEEV
ncbi:MAG: stage III sporulation protein AD, partial [Clostridia bacterium]|nr:stage III sporulation protein AD [Clostridia bacterium]